MYGPPTDPRQRLAPVEIFDVPDAYLICLIVGLLITLGSRLVRHKITWSAALFIAGQTLILTAPLGAFIDTWMYGSFPTIDKAGSMAFYLDGVHQRMLLDPLNSIQDPAARLIGVHVGHLWVTEFFDLFLSPIGAFNAQALLYPMLGWFSAWLLFHEVNRNSAVSLLFAFPFGMGLHVFRDLNWYTIEKSAVFWLPLYGYMLFRAWRDGGRWVWLSGLTLVVTTWMNVYFGLINCILLGVVVVGLIMSNDRHKKTMVRTGVLTGLFLVPIAVWQWVLMHGGPQLGTPEEFLWQRAALDSFTLDPFRWNRLEVHRSLNVVALAVAAYGLRRSRWIGIVRLASMVALLFFLLSLGPTITGLDLTNPIYMGARAVVPGFWRVAKPEVFFHMTWLMLLGIAAIQAHRSGWTPWTIRIWYAAFVVGWLIMVRTHPAYPPMTVPIDTPLAKDWADRVFDR